MWYGGAVGAHKGQAGIGLDLEAVLVDDPRVAAVGVMTLSDAFSCTDLPPPGADGFAARREHIDPDISNELPPRHF
jgi:hypothetical protein